MRYFITGATGFLGNVITRQLLAQGHQVNIVVRNPEKARELEALGAKVFRGDVTDKESMRAPMQDVEGLFHVAGWYKIGVRDKSAGEKVNVQGTRNVLELMKELGIPKGVYTSTLAVNSDTDGRIVDESYRFTGDHISEYDRTKAAGHDVAEQFISNGLPLVIAMPGLIYGPGDTSSLRPTLISYLKQELPMVPAKTAYCWGHVDDIARGHILLMEKGKAGESYHIPGEPYALADAMRLAEELTGVPAPRVVSPKLMAVMSVLATPFDSLLPGSYTSEGLRVIAGVTYLGSNAKARRELGYDPRPLRDGLRETLEHEMNLLKTQAAA